MIQYLKRKHKPDLAYALYEGREENTPMIMFLGGFRSDMEGTKAIFLENFCKEKELRYVRFDYSGHGISKGSFLDGCIGQWAADAQDILDHCAVGQVMLVGSSMGGWIAFLLALQNKERIHSIVGLAAAPDFTKIMEERMSEAQKKLLESQGYFDLENEYSDDPYIITKKLIDDGRERSLLHAPIQIDCRVRLIPGKKDTDVAWQTAEIIQNAIMHKDAEIIILDEADHRLSSPDQLRILKETILALI